MSLNLTDILREIIVEAQKRKGTYTTKTGKQYLKLLKGKPEKEKPEDKPTGKKSKKKKKVTGARASNSTRQAVQNSIKNRWLMNVYYTGDKENAPGRRWIEPYAYGVHKKSGNEILRAWQYQGKTTSIQPGWKMFRLDRFGAVLPLTTKTFDKPRDNYNAQDKDMSKVILAAKFDNKEED
jgi:hypothetical protein